MMNFLVFDIETVPDVASARRMNEWEGLSDSEVANALFALRREETGNNFLRLHLQRIVAISAVYRHGDQLAVWSLGDETTSEGELIQKFFDLIDRQTPTLVSWNGGGFDLPVLHYRGMLHGITAPRYWDTGRDDSAFKWNNYLSRYHERHTDLMDFLSLYQARASVPLDQLASLLGFPGKMGMSGAKVWDAFQAGELSAIRQYCETDVLNTWLVFLRFQLMRGQLTREHHVLEEQKVKEYLQRKNLPHFLAFLTAWENHVLDCSH